MAEYSTTAAEEEDKVTVIISDAEGGEDDDNIVENFDGSPHITLPPEVWAAVINYLPYDSLISCASTSRAILYDALPLVTTLQINKASQLSAGIVSSHLRDVRSVTIHNLFKPNPNPDSRRRGIQFDEEIATKSVPFLSRLPQLESIAFWGGDWDNLCSMVVNETPPDYGIRYLFDSFSGAFDFRTLPYNLQINGLRCPKSFFGSGWSCKVCERVCNKFPVESIGDVDLCLRHATINEIIMSRKGGRNYLQSETRFMQLLGKGTIQSQYDYTVVERVVDFTVIKYDSRVQVQLKDMIETSQVDITTLNREDVVKAITRHYPNNITVYLGEESFDYLKTTIGLPISNDLLDPWAIRVENLDRMVRSVMEEKDSIFCPVGGLDKIDSLLSPQNAPTQRVLESGVLPKLVEFMQRDDCDLKLRNVSSSILPKLALYFRKLEHVDDIVKSGAVQPLVTMMSFRGSSHTELILNATQALGNIASKGTQYRDLVLQAGVLEPLVEKLRNTPTGHMKLVIVRTYVWLLSTLCRGKPKPDINLESPSLETLNELIRHPDDEVVGYACCFLGYLCGKGSNNTHIQAMIDAHCDRCDRWDSRYHGYDSNGNVYYEYAGELLSRDDGVD